MLSDAVKLYYFWTADLDATLGAQQVKDLGTEVAVADLDEGSIKLAFDEVMDSETEYRVVAIAEDLAGNMSDVEDFTYYTDDTVAPELAEALPTELGLTDKFLLVFDEDVEPIVDAYARIIDANGVTYYAPVANLDGEDADANIISIEINAAGLPISDDVATYTVEVDPGMIVDVPRLTEDDDDANVANAYAGILGSSFTVVSDDSVPPVLEDDTVDFVNPTPYQGTYYDYDGYYTSLTPTFTLEFSEPVSLNDNFTNYILYVDEYYGDSNIEYDIITAANISGEGTTTITITTNRALVENDEYYLEVIDGTFSDANGNEWDNDGNLDLGYYRAVDTNDTTPLQVSFKTPYDGYPYHFTDGETIDFVPDDEICLVFQNNLGGSGSDGYVIDDFYAYDEFFLDAGGYNGSMLIDTYELKQHVYMQVDGVDVPFEIEYSSSHHKLWFYTEDYEGFEKYKGQTITYGFNNLYDEDGNLTENAEMSFTIAEDAVSTDPVTFIPGDNDGDDETVVSIEIDQTFTVEIEGTIFTYDAIDTENNNLVMTASLLQDLGVFSLYNYEEDDYVPVTIVSYVETAEKSIITLVATDGLDSETKYDLELDGSDIQIEQGNTDSMNDYDETYSTGDVVAPKLIADAEGVVYPWTYAPTNGGIVAKDDAIGLYFDEEVIGAGTIDIHRWSGEVVATVDMTDVESENTPGGWYIEVADLSTLTLDTDDEYYVIIPEGAIVDIADNKFAGIVVLDEWTFELRDANFPIPTFVQNMQTGVMVSSPMEITFDREVNGDFGWFAVYEEEDGDAVALIRIPPGADVSEVTEYAFDLGIDLMANTTYYAELGEGAFELSADNSVKQQQVEIGEWWFTTEIDAEPLAELYVPAMDETGVSLGSDLSITFDQEVVAGTGTIQLHAVESIGGPVSVTFDVTDPTQVQFSGNTVTVSASLFDLVSKY